MGLRQLLTLLPLVASIAQAQLEDTSTTDITTTNGIAIDEPEPEPASSPIYSSEECNNWISALTAADSDSSNGLSSSEYFSFLSSIEEPPYIAEYFQEYSSFGALPWVFRVVHKALACHCQKLGMGVGCCEGENAEVLMLGLEDSATGSTSARTEYTDLFCQQIAYVLSKSIQSPAPTAAPTFTPIEIPSVVPSSISTLAPVMQPSTLKPTNPPVAAGSIGIFSVPPTVAEPAAVPVRGVDPTVEEPGGLGTGGIIGIIVACLAVLLAIIALVAYRRKQEQEAQDQLRNMEVQAPETDLEAPPPAMEEKVLEPDPEAAVVLEQAPEQAVEMIPEQAPVMEPVVETLAVVEPVAVIESDPVPEPLSDDESSAPSVWSESEEDEDSVGGVQDDGIDDTKPSAGSALAAMGTASTLATSMMSPLASSKEADPIQSPGS